MKRSVSLVLVAVGAFLAGWLLGGPATEAQDEKTQPKLRGQLYPQWRKLGLTEEQVQKIYKIQADYRAKGEALELQIQKLKKEERAEAMKVLTDAQKARLKELTGNLPPDEGKTTPPKPPVPPKQP